MCSTVVRTRKKVAEWETRILLGSTAAGLCRAALTTTVAATWLFADYVFSDVLVSTQQCARVYSNGPRNALSNAAADAAAAASVSKLLIFFGNIEAAAAAVAAAEDLVNHSSVPGGMCV